MSSRLAFVAGNDSFIIIIINTRGNPLFARENAIYFPIILKILDCNVEKKYMKLNADK